MSVSRAPVAGDGDRTAADLSPATTLAQARAALAAQFAARGSEAPEREATLLILAASGRRGLDFHVAPDAPLGAAAERVRAFAARRLAGEPLSRIEGRRAFWSLDLAISPDVLDPRADTEALVEAAVEAFAARRDQPLRILDFGVGSGAVLCALLTEMPRATGVGIDNSEAAVTIARKNLEALCLGPRGRVQVRDWGAGLDETFDLIVSNPPYIRSADIAGLADEVRAHDPRIALDGGPDGLDAYRRLGPEIARLLTPEGRFFLEIGLGQVSDVREILSEAGLVVEDVHRDFAGIERVVAGTRGGSG